MTLKPGKGVHLVLNTEIIDFLFDRIERIQHSYEAFGGDDAHDENPKVLFRNMKNGLVETAFAEVDSDKFGEKVYFERPYPDGALRVTLILQGAPSVDRNGKTTSKGSLKLDIRVWYNG